MPERFGTAAFALLRVVAGLMFASNGAQKPFGMVGSPPLTGKAGIIELVCGLAITVGLFARPAAFLASGEMAVAMLHGACAGGPLACPEQGRGGFPPLLLLSLRRRARGRSLEPRRDAESARPGAPARHLKGAH